MPTARADRPARVPRRTQLVGIAAQLFAEQGFAGVTVDEIGAAAGVSGPALYHHFDSKEALLGEMLIDISQTLLDRATEIVRTVDEAARLDALIAMHVDFAVDDRPLITVHFRDLVHARDADRRRVRDLQNSYVDIWVDALTQSWPTSDRRTARAAVQAAFGLINSTPHSGRLRRDELVAMLNAMAAGALQSAVRAWPSPHHTS